MPALARLPTAAGAAAMRSINVTVITPSFMLALFGTALVCAILIAALFFRWDAVQAELTIAAGISYIVGTNGVTMVRNVPLNDALMAIPPESPNEAEFWRRFLTEWVFWNHIRTIAPTITAVLLILVLMSW